MICVSCTRHHCRIPSAAFAVAENIVHVSVMTILEIPFAYALQHIFFHDELSPLGLVGVGFVCAGTMVNLWRQWFKKSAKT